MDDKKTSLSPNEGVDPDEITVEENQEDLDRHSRAEEEEGHSVKESSPSLEDEEKESASESGSSPKTYGVKSREHTLDDLAEETTGTSPSDLPEADESLNGGREPVKPKRLFVDDDNESPVFSSQLPSSGVHSSAKGGGNKFKLILLLLIGVLVIGGSVYLLKNKIRKADMSASPTPSLSVSLSSPRPSPSPSPIFDRSKFKIRVLNGTSQTGLAGSVSAKLKTLGYQQDRVGNASNSAYTQTWVRVKDAAVGLVDQLIRDLSPDFSASANGKLPDSDSADGEVILGTK